MLHIVLQNWEVEYPRGSWVTVNRGEKEYFHTIHDNKGCLINLIYRRIGKVAWKDGQIWKQLEGNPHFATVIAYIEDENFGYLITEHSINGMVTSFNCVH